MVKIVSEWTYFVFAGPVWRSHRFVDGVRSLVANDHVIALPGVFLVLGRLHGHGDDDVLVDGAQRLGCAGHAAEACCGCCCRDGGRRSVPVAGQARIAENVGAVGDRIGEVVRTEIRGGLPATGRGAADAAAE